MQEGITRELVHRIQNMRKSAGFAIEDNIDIHYASDLELSEIIERGNTFNELPANIADETLVACHITKYKSIG